MPVPNYKDTKNVPRWGTFPPKTEKKRTFLPIWGKITALKPHFSSDFSPQTHPLIHEMNEPISRSDSKSFQQSPQV